jgi:molybdopterin molybdotransferase
MLEETEARRRLLQATPLGRVSEVSVNEALGAVVAHDLRAVVPVPAFDNSQMDGYAVRAVDACLGATLRITGEQPAGLDLGLHVEPGGAIRIFTGAPLPQGADAVVMQEDVDALPDQIRIREAAAPGEFVRRRGADLCLGQVILRQGESLTPARIGLLASQGWDRVHVRLAPVAAVITTGDELVLPGAGVQLLPGQIFNSNGPMLAAGLRACGVTRVHLLHAPDDPGKLRAVVEEALAAADFCLIAGGVSVGEKDLVKSTLTELGVGGGFWRVRVKPGKPFFFGTLGEKVVFGLPGNPVSSWITFLLFVRSALQRHLGQSPDPAIPGLPTVRMTLEEPLHNDGDRPHYVRGCWNPQTGGFRTAGLQQSHALYGLSRADSLVRLEPGERCEAGAGAMGYLMNWA